MQNVDRRDLLLGLGGLYGAANLTNVQSAFASKVTTPYTSCVDSKIVGVSHIKVPVRGLACCPPSSTKPPIDYVLHPNPVHRVRPAARKVAPDYIIKYEEAIRKMKELDDDHPWSWKQQGKIHCAYCNEAYFDPYTNKTIKVHDSWLFYPFHRWYLYFYERILGKLIGDESFALPYWNWDHCDGMTMPAMFEEPPVDNPDGKKKKEKRDNPIFDPYRNPSHLSKAVVDLEYKHDNKGDPDQDKLNLCTMYRQMVSGACTAETFFGTDPNAVNSEDKGETSRAGTVEAGAHTAMHIWVGNPRMPFNEDMGNFYSAGYDPLFYVHHANVDRMWKIWKDLNPAHKEPSSSDWGESSYVFYDENQQLVRVYNKDCVNINALGYNYDSSTLSGSTNLDQLQWLKKRPAPHATDGAKVAAKSFEKNKKLEYMKLPLNLDIRQSFYVQRPKQETKEKTKEVLLVNGIRFNGNNVCSFDVLVDDVDDGTERTPADSEFAGSFSQVPHMHDGDGNITLMTSGRAFVISELLEDLGASNEDFVKVTLVPRVGTQDATVSEIKIVRVPVE